MRVVKFAVANSQLSAANAIAMEVTLADTVTGVPRAPEPAPSVTVKSKVAIGATQVKATARLNAVADGAPTPLPLGLLLLPLLFPLLPPELKQLRRSVIGIARAEPAHAPTFPRG
mmetsp:Transcript_17413/g.30646  ORF Transcript_17413/g.30646 Transcript_17413/m.30646 type:complete len:115 (-) Transcript_17413:18-362(-)